MKKYFKQEIDFTERDIAFVDLYGSGRTQDNVSLDKETADKLGEIPYLIVGSEKDIKSAAPKIPFFEFLLNFILCRKTKKYTEFLFISIARSCA